MIDIEMVKPGQEVWILVQRCPTKLVVERLDKLHSDTGVKYNVVAGAYSTPVDWCYSSKMELIEDQINYWNDHRLHFILNCDHQWENGHCTKCFNEGGERPPVDADEVSAVFKKVFTKYYGSIEALAEK